MAKQTFPQLKQGGGILRKVIGSALLVAVLVLVVRYPADAASGVKAAWAAAGSLVDGLVTFLRSVGS
ncbi:hypothetical protein [Actinophytocola sp.]|uniref:hypothetical protein n=1 Tax=Actinophytocola sp. TaxID=1872138 RepID=UPI002D2BF4C3|nr:hypothetical protein [Actinophytocola sp.]HYQ66176.1 hypothetical protein [Actinophytocola sp.]